jgi:hypothetical protein
MVVDTRILREEKHRRREAAWHGRFARAAERHPIVD